MRMVYITHLLYIQYKMNAIIGIDTLVHTRVEYTVDVTMPLITKLQAKSAYPIRKHFRE